MAFIEDVLKRTQKAKHFYDADTGKWKAEFTIADRHYHDGNAWQDLDENFVTDGQGYDKKCDKTRHTFRLSNGGERRWYPRRNVLTEYVDITAIEYYTNRWRNLTLPTPVWTNNKTEWDMTDLYASITNTWKRIKSDFILKNSNAYTRLRFAVSFVGLTYNSTTGELTSATDGLVWGYIDKPTAKDANEIDIPVTQTYDGTYIEWSVNTTGATFPVEIDPTFTDGNGGDVDTACDVNLREDGTSTNYGTENIFQPQHNPGGSTCNALIKFTLTSLEGKTITSRTLYLYQNAANGDEETVYFNRILSANSGWTEAGATWNHAVENTVEWAGSIGCSTSNTDYAATNIGTLPYVPANGADYEYQVSLDATEFASMVGNNAGIRACLTEDWAQTTFHSSDYVGDATKRPKLVVEYTEGGEPCVNVVNATDVSTVTVPVTVVEWCEPP